MPAKLVSRPVRPTINRIRAQQHGPKLYNAKRLIDTSRGVRHSEVLSNLLRNSNDNTWRQHVSDDVAEFIDDMEAQGTKMLPKEKINLLRDPARFFSRPENVPKHMRTQVYFPKVTMSLHRAKGLGPYYVMFKVPMNFSKLDLRSYLKELYNVDVVHIRSQVKPGKFYRVYPANRRSKGVLRRTKSKKEMTVQLVEPFEFPAKDAEVDREAFNTDEYYDSIKRQREFEMKMGDAYGTYIDKAHRQKIAEQAREIAEGKVAWAPTWQQLPEAKRMITGRRVNLTEEEQVARNFELDPNKVQQRIAQGPRGA